MIFLLIIISQLLIHTKCKGNEGIPWWPNSGCDCIGIIGGGENPEYKNNDILVGGGAKYCIGFLREYPTSSESISR